MSPLETEFSDVFGFWYRFGYVGKKRLWRSTLLSGKIDSIVDFTTKRYATGSPG